MKILLSFHCGHGVLPEMSKQLGKINNINGHTIKQMFVLNSNQKPSKEINDYGEIRFFSTERLSLTPGYPDTDTRRRIAIEYGKINKFDITILMDDNIILTIEDILKLITNIPKGGMCGCVEKNSNREANNDKTYRERHANFPSALYPEANTWTHETLVDTDDPILCKDDQDNKCIPLGIGGCYKIQCVDTGTLSIDKLRKMFPHNGFEPWQDMWMMIWAWYLYIPVKVLHDVCYERVKYKSEQKNDRVKGRCKQTIGEYQNRIIKQTKKWPREMICHALGYIQHRGNRHYLKWDPREKFEFDLHLILTYLELIPEKMQTPIVLNFRDILQDNHDNISNGIKECCKYLSKKSQDAFNGLCLNSDMREISLPENVYWGRKYGLSKKQYTHPDFIRKSHELKEYSRSITFQMMHSTDT